MSPKFFNTFKVTFYKVLEIEKNFDKIIKVFAVVKIVIYRMGNYFPLPVQNI